MKTLGKPHLYWEEVSDEAFVRDFRRNLCEKFWMKPLNAVMLSESFTCIEHTIPGWHIDTLYVFSSNAIHVI